MLNANNQIIAQTIASAYCSNDDTCRASVFNRLNNYFDNENFSQFIATLPNRAYLIGNFINKGEQFNIVTIEFKYFDVITGVSGSATKRVPMSLFTDNRFDLILKIFVDSLIYVKKNSDNSILFINPDYGYNIAYTTNPTSGGNGGGTGGGNNGDERGGTLIVPSNQAPNEYQALNVPQVSSGFDFSSFIIPGAIFFGLYFFMNKK